uniref:histidine kinase n=1 Tax=Kalanchoe fedtschenkoi TaxID=63787 RepID=A0A7N0TE46_KALFE
MTAITGKLLDLSLMFLKICRWIFVKMSLNSKHSGSNGRVSGNLKFKKAKEPLLATKSCSRKWMSTIYFLWLLGAAVVFLWFLFCSDYETLEQTPSVCEDKAQFLLKHFNVTRPQLHALTSLFSETDQIKSLECIRVLRSDMALNNGMACALKVLCEDYMEFTQEHTWATNVASPKDQCPALVNAVTWKPDPSISEGEQVKHVHECVSTADSFFRQSCKNNISQTSATSKCAQDSCWQLSSPLSLVCLCLLISMIVSYKVSRSLFNSEYSKDKLHQPLVELQSKRQQQARRLTKKAGKWRKKFLWVFIIMGVSGSFWLFWHLYTDFHTRRVDTLSNMCDERTRMLQDQFNVSMNHVHALAILVSTFYHGKHPTSMDQKTFSEYTERTAFERPLTSGVAYALKVTHSEREEFERLHGWTIKRMQTEDQTLVQDCTTENLEPAPVQEEYAPVVFSQETVSHIVSIDMMSGKQQDRENILRARASGKGVLTSPFKLLKSNHLGVVLTFAVYNDELPLDAMPEQRVAATVGYLGASYDIPSLVDKLLHQLASKQTIVVNVYDTTNSSAPIKMYGDDVVDTGLLHISNIDFGDPSRRHEMHCRFKQKTPLPWTAIIASVGTFVITLLVGHIFYAAINRIAKVEYDCYKMMELKVRAEAADVAKSQFLATVSHEIRTPMVGVLGMLQMLMDTQLDASQQDYAETAHASGKDLISLINEVLDQAKIESERLELENVPFDLRAVLDNVLSRFSGKTHEKGIELAVYVSESVPEAVVGDPGRFRQIITNLVGNSVKFTHDRGHIFVSVHLADEVNITCGVRDKILGQKMSTRHDRSLKYHDTLSGFPVVHRWKSWENFKNISTLKPAEHSEMIKLLVTVEDTGVGIPLKAQDRIFTPFMQADSSTSRTYGGTGIGLSISSRLVELMGGEIGFVSEPGVGSTFSFTALLKKGDKSLLEKRWQRYDLLVSEFRGLKALVVDHRGIRAEVTKYHLQRLGISADTAFSMNSACECFSREHSMILIDKELYDEEPREAFHKLHADFMRSGEGAEERCRIYLLATSVSLPERDEIRSAGYVDNVLTKPLRLSVLIACFQEFLGNGKKRSLVSRKQATLGGLLKGKRILVVDDNIVNRRVAEGALKKHGAIVTCVESGMAAIALLKPPHIFDACFMDLQMPEMDGFEATRQIRIMEENVNKQIQSGEASTEIYGNLAFWRTPILAMTADVIQATNEELIKCGMDDYVSKPFEEEQLYSAVARFFESGWY